MSLPTSLLSCANEWSLLAIIIIVDINFIVNTVVIIVVTVIIIVIIIVVLWPLAMEYETVETRLQSSH